jgi:hypothetical protein
MDEAAPAAGHSRRIRRMHLLLIGIVILSVLDLLLTLDHLRTNGLLEANPLVVALVESTQSVWVLVLYKSVSVGICVGVLFSLRRHRSGEIGAWCGLAVLVGLSVLWNVYEREVAEVPQIAAVDDGWLRLD